MLRIKKLENHYHEQLTEHQIKDISVFIHSIVDADITKGKYARFLIESFLNNKFLEEDLMGGLESTIGKAISLFDKHKGKLPINERSVYTLNPETKLPLYQSPGDLWKSVKQYQGELSGKELKKEEQEKIYRETKFVYKNKETGFQIVSPLTEESAKWWGKGTRWCTSAENNNVFWSYAKDAPLLILLIPSNVNTINNNLKLQLWKYNNDIQFMDDTDNEVTLEYIEQYWNILEPLCLWLNDLRFIPDRLKTPELCELAVKNNGFTLSYVPENLKTKELCELAIQQNGWALRYVPDRLKTQELCELAVQQNGYALRYIPEELKTKELCKLAIKQDGIALQYVPEELRTKELCELAFKNNVLALRYVPDEYRTKELYNIAVQQNGMALGGVPKKFKTPELYKLAVKNNGLALYYVPDEYRTPELCQLAVEQKGFTLQYISEELRTKELYELAVKNNGYALRFVPEKFKTPELCELAVKDDGINLQYIPEELKTYKLCELAVKQNDKAFKYIPDKYKNKLNSYKINDEYYNNCFSEIKQCFPQNILSLDNK